MRRRGSRTASLDRMCTHRGLWVWWRSLERHRLWLRRSLEFAEVLLLLLLAGRLGRLLSLQDLGSTKAVLGSRLRSR